MDSGALIPSPQEIGEKFRRARQSHVESVRQLLECGKALNAIKDSLPHGEWMLWVKEHQESLGFGIWTAVKLMRGAKLPLTANLTEEEAQKLGVKLWANEKPIESMASAPAPSIPHLESFLSWIDKHPAQEAARALPWDEAEQVQRKIDHLRVWFDTFEAARQARVISNGKTHSARQESYSFEGIRGS